MARILVIDDEEPVLALLGRILASSGHEVLLAGDGRRGIKLYRESPADLIIVDLFMPEQDGFETMTLVRKFFPQTPIIAISGNELGPMMLSIAHTLGAVAVFSKPFSNEDLLSSINNALKSDAKSN